MEKTKYLGRKGWLSLLLLGCISAFAQTEENVNIIHKVAVRELSYTPKAKQETIGSVLTSLTKSAVTGEISEPQDGYADAVRAAIVGGLSRVRRFQVVEGGFVAGEVAEGEEAFYLDGTIGSISTTQKTVVPEDNKKKSYNEYRGQISATLMLKDAHTDAVVVTGNFNVSGSDCAWLESADGALNDAIRILTRRVARHFNIRFPLQASIIERGEIKKEKQKEVFLNIGSAAGAYEGQWYDIMAVSIIAGKEAKHKIGSLRIEEVMGDDISRCDVVTGSKNVKLALDEGQKLIMYSTE